MATDSRPHSTRPDKTLRLNYSGRIIDHLGIQMYQSPVAAIAELVANAWDADATRVAITLPEALGETAEVIVKDDGVGMNFEECDERFLNVGYARRGHQATERSPSKDRSILGRKGIGKFAGFGIAQVIEVETISEQNGERTVFEMDIDRIRSGDYVNTGGTDITVIAYEGPDNERCRYHGTTVRLKRLSMQRNRTPQVFARSMARRFLLHQLAVDFQILVNNHPLPEEDLQPQFSFPRDYRDNERPGELYTDDEWGTESVAGEAVRWRIRFYEDPISDEELQGIGVFAGGKMVQSPFFFNLAGGLSGQHGQQYISGQILADFLDAQEDDLIAPERQRVNWDHPAAAELQNWGQERLRQLLAIWRDRRGEQRQKVLVERLHPLTSRLDKLGRHERRTVMQAVKRLAQVETLSQGQFEELGTALLTAWEQGRLRDLIDRIAQSDDMDADHLIEILAEAEVLTALNMAEAVMTKLQAVEGLEKRIENRDLENAVRDYISQHPWLVSPKWETFAVEQGVKTLVQQAAKEAGMDTHEDFKGRIDLALASGEHLLILEFMRPGLTLDWDHVDRFDQYIRIMRDTITANTGADFNRVTGYIIADRLHTRTGLPGRIEALVPHGMFAMDWSTLLRQAAAQWRDFFDILVTRNPQDERLQMLRTEPPE